MHEYSIVQALIEQCETLAQQHGATQIHKVVVKIGVLSGVEPHLFEVAFATFKETSALCAQAVLEMKIQAVEVHCQACFQVSQLHDHHYVCPLCHSPNILISDGEEMLLMQLEMA